MFSPTFGKGIVIIQMDIQSAHVTLCKTLKPKIESNEFEQRR